MDTEMEKLTISRRKQTYGGPRLRVLLTNEILCHLLPCMMPQDAVDFLGCHPQASFRSCGWQIMRRMLKMDAQLPGLESVISYKDNRDLMLHVIRKYGLCCSDCFCLLDGPNGFFCCTSLCKSCSLNRFTGCTYVDSVVRFYLCGSDNITVKGKAFLIHPFWYGEEDESGSIIKRHGTALRLAELIYKEKIFFASHASQLDRPRDDKAASIRCMLTQEVLDMRTDTAGDTQEREEMKEEPEAQSCTDANMDTSTDEFEASPHQQCSSSTSVESVPLSEESRNGKLTKEDCARLTDRIDSSWGPEMPDSLQQIYHLEFAALKTSVKHEVRHNHSLGTMPLRDLVKNLHGRNRGASKMMS